MSTKRSHILKQTFSFQLQVYLSMCDLSLGTMHWRVNTFLRKIVSFWYGTDGISWFINEINGRSLFSIKCGKRLVTPPEVRVFQLVNIEVNYTFIQTIWIIVSIRFVYDFSLSYKFINSVSKVFFTCIFKIYLFISSLWISSNWRVYVVCSNY